MLSKRPEATKYDMSSVGYITSAAAPLKKELQNAVAKRLGGAAVVQSWGMTETTCTGLMIPGLMTDENASVGFLLPNTEAKLVDADEKDCTLSRKGELWMRGPQIMSGYWQNQEATAASLTPDGWLKTGDIVTFAEGRWWIVDRRKEMIKVNGLQVAPAELEAVLLEHKDVVDAAVIGTTLRDEETPRAYIVPSDAVRSRDNKGFCDLIETFVAGKVSKHKRLKGGIVVVDKIPRLLSGKIQRSIIKAWAQKDAMQIKKGVEAKL
jgi:acyl-coenzyme A synthetase/AMP-(fatty) acid ligase